ncbi:acetyl-CoA synthetase-like protein [Atractiella rhizophila]|nr:acetyl-CoA synthetase-like protein [Atractiella rhizophila]
MSYFPRLLPHTLTEDHLESYSNEDVHGEIAVEELKERLKELLRGVTAKDGGGFWLSVGDGSDGRWKMEAFGDESERSDVANVFLSFDAHSPVELIQNKKHALHFVHTPTALALTSPFSPQYSRTLINHLLHPSNKNDTSTGLSIINHPAQAPSSTIPLLLHTLFSRSVTLTPTHPALVWLSPTTSLTWSYAVLSSHATVIARALASRNIHDQIVPLLLDSDTPFVYPAMLGILKSGNAFCPLPTDLAVGTPASRVEYMMKDTGAKRVVCSKAKVKEFEEAGGKREGWEWLFVEDLEFAEDGREVELEEWTDVKREEDDLAYCLYTSGTTGNPKGVLLPHKAVAASLLSHPFSHSSPSSNDDQNEKEIQGPERVLAHIPLTFDVSMFEVFYPLLHSKTICSLSRSIALSPSPDFERYVERLEVDMIEATPTRLAMLDPSLLKGVRIKSTIGEMITKRVIEAYASSPSPSERSEGSNTLKELINFFGPTEAAIQCTSRLVHSTTHASNVGHPFAPTSIFIFPPPSSTPSQDLPLLRGCVGEIVLGGHQLARGYLNLPTTTERAFFEHAVFGRLYRTGDRGVVLPDGSLEVRGRGDEQVKRNGVRIELSEITRAVLGGDGGNSRKEEEGVTMQLLHPSLGEDDLPYLVTIVRVEGEEKTLFRTDDKAREKAKEMRKSAADKLPLNMRPIPMIVPRWPVNLLNGKLEKGRIRAEFEKFDLGKWRNSIEEQDGKERAVMEVVDVLGGLDALQIQAEKARELLEERGWMVDVDALKASKGVDAIVGAMKELKTLREQQVEQVLGKLLRIGASDQVGLNSNLITTYGLDSLSAVRFSSALRNSSLQISPLDILRSPTLKSIASRVVHLSRPDNDFVLPPTPASVIERVAKQLGVEPNQIDGVYRASPLQSGMIFATLSAGESAYVRHWKYILEPDVGVQQMKAAWMSVLGKHKIWRTAFVPAEDLGERFERDSYAMVVLNKFEMEWGVSEQREEIEKEISQSELRKPPVYLSCWEQEGSWVIMFSAHHSLYDGRTIELLEEEVQREYEGDLARKDGERQEFFSTSERILQENEKLDFHSHWMKRLVGYEPQALPDLSETRLKGPKRFHILQRRFSIPEGEIKSLCSSAGFASFRAPAAVATAYCVGAYAGTKDFVVGEVLNGRIGGGAEDIMGPLITTVPLRVDAVGKGKMKWGDLVKEVEGAQSEDWEFQFVEPATIRKILGLKDQAVFSTIFVFQSGSAEEKKKVTWKRWIREAINENVDVEHQVAVDIQGDDDGYMVIELTADSHYFSENSAKILMDQIDGLLSHIVSKPDSLLGDSLLKNSFPRDLLSVFGRPDFNDIPAFMSHEWVSKHAKERPDAIAVEVENERDGSMEYLTYLQLENRSNQFARFLAQVKKIKEEEKVAICMHRTTMFHVALLAVMKAKGCYVPVATEVPMERKQYILSDSQSSLVITTSEFSDQLQRDGCEVLLLDNDLSAAVDQYPTQPFDSGTYDLRSLAFLLYTSGSTGNPKGCLLNHDGLYHAIVGISQHAEHFTNPDHDKYMGLTSLAFDVHLCETFVAWRLGIRVSTADRTFILNDLEGFIRRHKITHVSLVPSLFEGAIGEPETPLDIKFVASGGERITDTLLERWADKSTLMNFFGPAEATIGVSGGRMKVNSQPSNVGQLFPACQGWIVDDDLQCVLRGQAGELVVTGPLVGRGYHRLEDQTKRSFLDNWPVKGLRSYKTGDIVRVMPDDTIEILGRRDSQIKIRGVRIEPEGISQKLKKVLDYQYNIATVPIFEKGKAKSLTVFVAKAGQSASTCDRPIVLSHNDDVCKRVVHTAEEVLPSYMRPSRVLHIDALPLGATGKVDLKLLRNLHDVTINAVLSARPSETLGSIGLQIQQLIAHQMKLEVQNVPSEAHLFELGYDSATLVRLTSALRNRFNTPITIRQVLSNPTLSGVTALLQQPADKLSTFRKDPLKDFRDHWEPEVGKLFAPEQYEDVLPAFTMQEGVVFRALEDPKLYVNHFLFRLSEDVDAEKLEQCWRKMVGEHEILRLVHLVRRRLIQVVLKPEHVPVSFERGVFDPTDQHFALKLVSGLSDRWADDIVHSEDRPPYRLSLLSSQTSRQVILALSIHHSLYDAVSIRLLLESFETNFRGRKNGHSSRLCDILREVALHPIDSGFWIQWLGDFDFRSQRVAKSSSAAKELTLNSSVTRGDMERLSKTLSITMQALAQTAFGLTLTWYEKRHDVVYGVIRAGRSLPLDNIENSIAPTMSILPFRFSRSSSDVASLTQQCQDSLNNVMSREQTTLSSIQQALGRRDLFHAVFSVISSPRPLDASIWSEIPLEEDRTPDYPLAVELVIDEVQNQVIWHIVYDPSGWDGKVASDFLWHLENSLKNLLLLNIGDSDSNPMQVSAPNAAFGVNILQDDLQDHIDIIIPLVRAFLGETARFIRPEEDLIRYGLDSIGSLTLSKDLRKAGLQISASDLLAHSSIEKLARFLASQTPKSEVQATDRQEWLSRIATDLPDWVTVNGPDCVQIAPATPLQSGMLSQTIASGTNLYVNQFKFSMSNEQELRIFQRACKSLTDDADILRTSFAYAISTGEWVQVIHPPGSLFRWSEGIEEIDSLYHDEEAFRRPPVVWRAQCQEFSVTLTIHHALYDASSLQVLLSYLAAFCSNVKVPRLTSFAPTAWAIYELQDSSLEYWVQQLQDAPIIKFQKDRIDSMEVTSSAATIASVSSSEIGNITRELGITLDSVGQFLCALMLQAITGLDDVVFGQIISGRGGSFRVEHADAFGPVFNTIVRRERVRAGTSSDPRSRLQAIHERNITSLARQCTSLQRIQTRLGRGALFDCLYTFMVENEEVAPTSFWKLKNPDGPAAPGTQYSLNFEMLQEGERIRFLLTSNGSVFSSGELEEILTFLDSSLIRTAQALSKPRLTFQGPLFQVIRPGLNGHTDCSSRSTQWSVQALKLFHLLSQMLQVEESSISEGQFLSSLGLDSITAIRLSGLARRSQLFLPASKIIKCQTVGDLLELLPPSNFSGPSIPQSESPLSDDSSGTTDGTSMTTPSLHDSTFPTSLLPNLETVLPLSSGQTFLLEKWLDSGRSRFHNIFVWRCNESVIPSQLFAAWDSLIQRHQLLRSVPWATSSGDVQHLVLRFQSANVANILELSPREGFLTRFIYDWAEECFDATQPGAEFRVLRSDQGIYYVAFKLLHSLYDAFSLPIIMEDFVAIYRGEQPESDVNYRSFITTARLPSQDPAFLKFWRSQQPIAPSCWPLKEGNRLDGATRRFVSEPAAIPGLRQLQRTLDSLHISLPAFLLGVLCKISVEKRSASTAEPQQQAVFGLYTSGRSSAVVTSTYSLDRLAGPTLNVLPLVVNQVQQLGTEELAVNISRTLETLVDFEQSAHRDIAQVWEWDEKVTLTNTMVNLVRVNKSSRDVADDYLLQPVEFDHFLYVPKNIGPSYVENARRTSAFMRDDFSLDIIIDASKDQIGCAINCNSNILDDDGIRQFIQDFREQAFRFIDLSTS